MELASVHRRVPVYREIAGDGLTPIGLCMNFSGEEDLFLLESANLDSVFSRFTFFGFRPRQTLTYRDGTLRILTRGEEAVAVRGNPIEYLIRALADEESAVNEERGYFCGGWVGFIGYDCANHMGILRTPIREDHDLPSMIMFHVDEFYVFDNHRAKLYAAYSAKINGDPTEAYRLACRRTLEMAWEIHRSQKLDFPPTVVKGRSEDFDRESFIKVVRSLKEEIAAGECIQAVISNRYEITGEMNPLSLYRLMRHINPSPYMFYLQSGGNVLCGTSPEIHLKIREGIATLKPIAGTYRLDGGDPEEIASRLLADEKERAEHLMLLDLARNDLYTGCGTESVRVVSSFCTERYSHVVHIVSEVRGRICEGISPLRLFCNTFPAGTVSGAPKVRAMELIDQYERSPRGFYAGCAGYFSYSQDIDTCIVIRSAFAAPDRVILRAGAGIVYDSDPETEYREVGVKLGALFDAMQHINMLEEKNVFVDR